MTIRSPKTAHHVGHESRIVPVLPELRSILGECFDAAPDGAEFVFAGRIRDGCVNLRTQLERIVERAGLKPWPKIWQNLRATRATELAAEHPGHVAAEWLGHSKLVAQKHYWRVTDADFTKALADNQNPPKKPLAESNALVAKTALQTQARQPIAIEGKPVPRARKVQGTKEVTSENPGETRGSVDNQDSPDRGRTIPRFPGRNANIGKGWRKGWCGEGYRPASRGRCVAKPSGGNQAGDCGNLSGAAAVTSQIANRCRLSFPHVG